VGNPDLGMVRTGSLRINVNLGLMRAKVRQYR
jgi:hypothetical protein